MDWQERENIPVERRWLFMLACAVVFFLVASAASLCVGVSDSHAQAVEAISKKKEEPASVLGEVTNQAVDINLPAAFHAWGEFEPGAWHSSRTIIEGRRLGRYASKTLIETNEILREKSFSGRNPLFSTVTETSILLTGKSIQKEPRTVTTDFWGLAPEETRTITELKPETLVIEGAPIRCRVLQILTVSENIRREIRLWVNENTAPYLFRRERNVFQKSSTQCCENSVLNVTSLNLQLCVRGKVLNGYQYSQVARFPTYISTSETVASLSAPGRVVKQITHEKDLRGRPLQDISTELLDYGLSNLDYPREVYGTSSHSEPVIIVPGNLEAGTGNSGAAHNGETIVSETGETVKADVESRDLPMTVELSAQKPNEEVRGAEITSSETPLLPSFPKNTSEMLNEKFRPMDNRFFLQFQSYWKIGKELQSEDTLPEIDAFFPNLQLERKFILERGVESSFPKGISPIYNEKLRTTHRVQERETSFGKRIRVITTQSLRDAYETSEMNEEKKVENPQENSLKASESVPKEISIDIPEKDETLWRRGVRALILRRTEK